LTLSGRTFWSTALRVPPSLQRDVKKQFLFGLLWRIDVAYFVQNALLHKHIPTPVSIKNEGWLFAPASSTLT